MIEIQKDGTFVKKVLYVSSRGLLHLTRTQGGEIEVLVGIPPNTPNCYSWCQSKEQEGMCPWKGKLEEKQGFQVFAEKFYQVLETLTTY